MREVWLTQAGNLRVYKQELLEYTTYQGVTQYFTEIAERRYNFMIIYGYEYLGEL